MKVIGLTGGIGSGKSTVSGFLAELGAAVINVDQVGHELLRPGNDTGREIVSVFGESVLDADGSINRQKLGDIVFAHPDLRLKLNQIMHPRMFEIAKARMETYRRRRVPVLVLEAPLLIEAGWLPLVDEVWVTVASEATIIQRLKARSGLTTEQTRARFRAQISPAQRAGHATVIINTDCSLEELKKQVKAHWDRVLANAD